MKMENVDVAKEQSINQAANKQTNKQTNKQAKRKLGYFELTRDHHSLSESKIRKNIQHLNLYWNCLYRTSGKARWWVT